MTTTSVFSGPSANGPQARNALVGAGGTVRAGDNNWGLPDSPSEVWTGERDAEGNPIPGTGEWESPPAPFATSFITCEGTDPAIAVNAVKSFGFVLRSTWPSEAVKELQSPVPNLADEIAALKARLDAIEGVK